MAITKFIPQQVPFQASDNLRAFLDDQMQSIAPLLNNAAQRNEDEIIEGDWTFSGGLVIPQSAVTDHQAALALAASQIISGTFADARLSSNVVLKNAASNELTGVVRIVTDGDAGLLTDTHGLQIGPTAGQNIILDGNEIMARNNGAAAGLFLNFDGGVVSVGGGGNGEFLVIGSDAEIRSTTAGGIAQIDLIADKNNVGETQNPYLFFSQDGGFVTATVGLSGATAVDSKGNTLADGVSNWYTIHASHGVNIGASGQVQFRMNGSAFRFFNTDQTGVAVTAAAIHTALVNLGLIT